MRKSKNDLLDDLDNLPDENDVVDEDTVPARKVDKKVSRKSTVTPIKTDVDMEEEPIEPMETEEVEVKPTPTTRRKTTITPIKTDVNMPMEVEDDEKPAPHRKSSVKNDDVINALESKLSFSRHKQEPVVEDDLDDEEEIDEDITDDDLEKDSDEPSTTVEDDDKQYLFMTKVTDNVVVYGYTNKVDVYFFDKKFKDSDAYIPLFNVLNNLSSSVTDINLYITSKGGNLDTLKSLISTLTKITEKSNIELHGSIIEEAENEAFILACLCDTLEIAEDAVIKIEKDLRLDESTLTHLSIHSAIEKLCLIEDTWRNYIENYVADYLPKEIIDSLLDDNGQPFVYTATGADVNKVAYQD